MFEKKFLSTPYPTHMKNTIFPAGFILQNYSKLKVRLHGNLNRPTLLYSADLVNVPEGTKEKFTRSFRLFTVL